MIQNFFLIGKPGSGKSEAARLLLERAYRAGLGTINVSDRQILNGLVVEDAARGPVNADGWHVGTYSWVRFDEADQPVLKAMSGRLWNEAHRQMIESVGKNKLGGNVVRFFELAIGPNVHFEGEDLLQEADHFFHLADLLGVSSKMGVIEIESTFADRAYRNEHRPADRMDPEVFKLYFPDGGEGSYDMARAHSVGTYHRFVNNGFDPKLFELEIDRIFREVVLPRVTTPEGNRHKREIR